MAGHGWEKGPGYKVELRIAASKVQPNSPHQACMKASSPLCEWQFLFRVAGQREGWEGQKQKGSTPSLNQLTHSFCHIWESLCSMLSPYPQAQRHFLPPPSSISNLPASKNEVVNPNVLEKDWEPFIPLKLSFSLEKDQTRSSPSLKC